MTKTFWLLAFALSATMSVTSARAGSYRLTASPTGQQQLSYQDGKATLLSRLDKSNAILVVMRDSYDDKEGPLFLLGVLNGGASPVNLTETNVTASTISGPIDVLTVGDLQEQARQDVRKQVNAARWRGIGAALSGAGAAMSANSSGYYSGSATTFGNNTYVNGTYTPPRDTSLQQAQAARQVAAARQDMDAARASVSDAYEMAEKYGFKPATVQSGEKVFSPLPLGVINRKADAISVSVTIGYDVHRFDFQLQRYR